MKKDNILDNVTQYTAAELVDFILQGIVTFNELVTQTYGQFDPSKRKEVKRLLETRDADEWAAAKQSRTINAILRYLDMFPNGKFRDDARDLKAVIENENSRRAQKDSDDAEWANVDPTSKVALQSFISNNPGNSHLDVAKRLLNQILMNKIMGVNVETLVSQIRQYQTDNSLTPAMKDNNIISDIQRFLSCNKISKEEFLEKMREDHNLLSASVVKRLIDSGDIAVEDLLAIGIDTLFIQEIFKGESAQTFTRPEKLEKIHKQSTEVYFWGIPSSGKSCALGAILSVAASGRVAKVMDPDIGSQGYGYMIKLINLFQNGVVGTLMPANAVDDFYEMGFDLVDQDDKIHPITFIDMAGELMRCMFKANANQLMIQTEVEMLDTLTRILIGNRSINRKMHIFVIEYGAEDRFYEGYTQRVYLEGALSYIKNTDIFKKDTDAIYIMITKADKAKNLSKKELTQYINEKYLGFFNGLEQICKKNGINKGRVEMIAFSLGEVCFQRYCRFDSRSAENVVKIILKRSANFRDGIRGWLEKLFRS